MVCGDRFQQYHFRFGGVSLPKLLPDTRKDVVDLFVGYASGGAISTGRARGIRLRQRYS